MRQYNQHENQQFSPLVKNGDTSKSMSLNGQTGQSFLCNKMHVKSTQLKKL